MNWMIFLGFGLSLVSALLIYFGQQKISDEQSESLRTELAERDKKLKENTDEIIGLNKELANKSDLLSKKSDQLNEIITGENRYPVVTIQRIQAGETRAEGFTFHIFNDWKYLLRDVDIQIFDYEAVLKFTKKSNGLLTIKVEDKNKCEVYRNRVSVIPAKGGATTDVFKINPNGQYLINLSSSGSIVVEKFVFHTVGTDAYFGYLIESGDEQTVLREVIESPPSMKELIRQKLKAMTGKIALSN